MPKYTSEGYELHYEDVGSGPPIVLIHGAAGAGRGFLETVVPHFQDSFRLLIPDLRGMGQSARVEGDLPNNAWVVDVCALLDATGEDRAHFIGVSLGSRVATRVAIDAPERVITLVPDAPIIANESQGNAALNAGLGDIKDGSDVADRHRKNHGEDWRDVVSSYFRIRNQPDLQEYYNLRPYIADMTVPTLLTRGDIDDPVHQLAHAFEWHKLLPSSWLWIVPEVGASAVNARASEFRVLYERFLAHATETSRN